MSLNGTTTKSSTIRDMFNSGILGKEADASQKAPLGDMLSILFDAANPNTAVAATTVGGAVANTGVTSPANVNYTQADQTALATCVLALVVQINLLRTDVLALRAELATAMTGTLGGLTESHVAVSSNVATMAQAATSVVTVRATTGSTTGVCKLIRDPQHTLATGEVYWDGGVNLTFAAVDVVTACDVVYAKGDLSQKVSALLATTTP